MVVTGDHSSVKAPSSTAHSEKCSQDSRAWPRTRGHGRRGHAGGQDQVTLGLVLGKDVGFVYKEKPLKAALQNMVLYINKHLRNSCFSDVTG